MSIELAMPEIPSDIFNAALEDQDLFYHDRCRELWQEVIEEVMEEEYSGRQHHNTGTYNQGCRGPLCRKANREHPRRNTTAPTPLQLRDERVYDPVLEYFNVIIRHRVRTAQQTILKELKEQV